MLKVILCLCCALVVGASQYPGLLSRSVPIDLLPEQSEASIRGGAWNVFDGDCYEDGYFTECSPSTGIFAGGACSTPGAFGKKCTGQYLWRCDTSWFWDTCVFGAALPTTTCPQGSKYVCAPAFSNPAVLTWHLIGGTPTPANCGTYRVCPSYWDMP